VYRLPIFRQGARRFFRDFPDKQVSAIDRRGLAANRRFRAENAKEK
jgi:hypothetical protein